MAEPADYNAERMRQIADDLAVLARALRRDGHATLAEEMLRMAIALDRARDALRSMSDQTKPNLDAPDASPRRRG